MHQSLINYIAGEMVEHDMTAAQAVLHTFETFRASPQAAAENADMLAGFDPINNPVAPADIALIEAAAVSLKRIDRKLGISE